MIDGSGNRDSMVAYFDSLDSHPSHRLIVFRCI